MSYNQPTNQPTNQRRYSDQLRSHRSSEGIRTVQNKLCEQSVETNTGTLGWGDRGSTVVKVLCYKSEGRWFDPSLCQWIFH